MGKYRDEIRKRLGLAPKNAYANAIRKALGLRPRPEHPPLPLELRATLRGLLKNESEAQLARALDVHPHTLHVVIHGEPTEPDIREVQRAVETLTEKKP